MNIHIQTSRCTHLWLLHFRFLGSLVNIVRLIKTVSSYHCCFTELPACLNEPLGAEVLDEGGMKSSWDSEATFQSAL